MLDGDITHVLPMPVETVGSNAIGVEEGLEAVVRGLKAQLAGRLQSPGQTWRKFWPMLATAKTNSGAVSASAVSEADRSSA
ncbi:hypothetical protein AB4Z40_21620 [Bosea sp. 2YAB26]|uniref:hypothetical protein n=1 Tax=Bosea sp. 2YAB26 TaxID=3237478 RepID=UPI003F921C21